MIERLTRMLLAHTLRTKREASEERIPFTSFNPSVSAHAVATRYRWPYTHIVVDDFLTPAEATAVRTHLETLVLEQRFAKRKIYDLHARTIAWGEHPSLGFLFDLKFKACLEDLFGQTLTEHVAGYMHSNTPHTDDKYIHTDYSEVFFMPEPPCGRLANTIPPGYISNILEYDAAPPGSVIERRAVVAILYLSADWEPGHGGETGIFAQVGQKQHCVAKIEPRFNRLLLFENTPYSFHNYIASSLPRRNSIIQWFHVPRASYAPLVTD